MAEEKKDELKELKEKYGTVYALTVPTNDEETEFATIYLRKLDRVCLQSVSKLIQKDELLAVESLIKTLRIGGCQANEITSNLEALRAAAIAVVPMLQAKEGILKKN